jgi:hypothetical protein
MVLDFDFKLGRSHLRGNGWRGLIALGIVVVLRAATLAAIVISARPVSQGVVRLLGRLIGI